MKVLAPPANVGTKSRTRAMLYPLANPMGPPCRSQCKTRPEQTKPEQTKPDQTRPDHTRADQGAAGLITGAQGKTQTEAKSKDGEFDDFARSVLAILGIPDSLFIFQAVRASIKTKCTHAGLTGAEAAKFIAGKGLDAKMNKPPESWLGWFRDARYDQITREEQDRQFLERNLRRDS
jgi:hypothetical protein